LPRTNYLASFNTGKDGQKKSIRYIDSSIMSTPMSEHVPIPGPRGMPLVGNVLDIESEIPLRSLNMMADTYGMH
jgi:hypothetical protein